MLCIMYFTASAPGNTYRATHLYKENWNVSSTLTKDHTIDKIQLNICDLLNFKN
jgi:hypothetical protein